MAEKNTISFQQGAQIAKEGDPGGDLYIIRSGVCEVYREREGKDLILAHIGAGEILGVMTASTQGPRSASIRAKTAVTAQHIDKVKVAELMKTLPTWGMTLIKDLILRVEQSNELFQKSFLALQAGLPMGKFLTMGIQVAEGFMPLAETVAAGTEDKTAPVDEVLDRLGRILNESYHDLQRVMDVFDQKKLVPWKAATRSNKCKVSELDSFRHFANFVRNAQKDKSLGLIIEAFPVTTRKSLRIIGSYILETYGKDETAQFSVPDLEAGLQNSQNLKLDSEWIKILEKFKWIKIDKAIDPPQIICKPLELNNNIISVDALIGLDGLDDRSQRIGRTGSVAY